MATPAIEKELSLAAETLAEKQPHSEINVVYESSPLDSAKQFSWNGVGLTVKIKEVKVMKEKELLQEMHGQVNAGEVVAIMGGSGAGKSTLLNTLAGRIADTTTLTGDILVDGHPRNMANWRIQCAYVEQDDIMYRNLTVFETLRYSALLRLPSSVSPAEKLERVNHVIATLGLNGCRDTIIGDTVNRGISGGERKRVSIGIELVTNPQILFLDEPTSGLDAFNALNLITTLKKLAVEQNKIILMTIHQPRTDILNMLDKILLLSMGKCVWFGSCSNALTHFSDMGYEIPDNTNPSDFFLDITTLDQRTAELKQETTMRIEKFVAAFRGIKVEKPRNVVSQVNEKQRRTQWPSLWIGEFSILLRRNVKNTLRDKAAIGATIGQSIFLFVTPHLYSFLWDLSFISLN